MVEPRDPLDAVVYIVDEDGEMTGAATLRELAGQARSATERDGDDDDGLRP